jgi:prepilin-type processing-associated H-X9-DG protein
MKTKLNTGKYGDQGWVRYNRHSGAANYVFTDGHVSRLPWAQARFDEYPDGQIQQPLSDPPQ